MNFSKVKLIMIACLVAANIILGFFCVGIYNGTYTISEEEALFASNHLEKNGIHVQFTRENLRKLALPVYSYAVNDQERVPETYRRVSEAFFNRKIHNTEYVAIPEGFSVKIKNNDGVSIGSSTLKTESYFECSLDGYFVEEISETISKSFCFISRENSDDSDNRAVSDKFVKDCFKKSGFDIRYTGQMQIGEGTAFFYCMFLSDKPVIDTYLNIYSVKDKIVLVCGNIPYTLPQKAYSTDMTDSIDALYNLTRLLFRTPSEKSEDASNEINVNVSLITPTYKIISGAEGEYYVIPTWRIDYSCDNGEEQSALIDAIVGENIYTINQ